MESDPCFGLYIQFCEILSLVRSAPWEYMKVLSKDYQL